MGRIHTSVLKMATPFAAGTPAGGTTALAAALAQSQLLSPANLAAAARTMYTRIDSFTGEYKYLSLDFPALIYFQGRFFPTARHALLAAKHPKAVEELAAIQDVKELKQVAKTKEVCPVQSRRQLARWSRTGASVQRLSAGDVPGLSFECRKFMLSNDSSPCSAGGSRMESVSVKVDGINSTGQIQEKCR